MDNEITRAACSMDERQTVNLLPVGQVGSIPTPPTKYPEFNKIPRLSRECTITEKIDGSNGLLRISEYGELSVGSRTRWITPADDNYGFCAWAYANKEELLKLGAGDHYGEWWGSGIRKRYVNQPKTFSLFNTKRWNAENKPFCCSIVPILYQGIFSGEAVAATIAALLEKGSAASPGCMRPEGIIIWHTAAQTYFKKTFDKDDEWKGKSNV